MEEEVGQHKCLMCVGCVGLNYDFTVLWSPNQQMEVDRG